MRKRRADTSSQYVTRRSIRPLRLWLWKSLAGRDDGWSGNAARRKSTRSRSGVRVAAGAGDAAAPARIGAPSPRVAFGGSAVARDASALANSSTPATSATARTPWRREAR